MINAMKKRLYIQILAASIPVIIIIGLFFIPYLLRTDAVLVPIKFTTTEQSGGNGVITMRGSFNRDLPENETLWLYAENALIEITIFDKQIRFNERENTPTMFRSPGSDWYSLVSPGIMIGEPVEFTVCSYYNESSRAAEILFSRLYIGNGNGLIGLMLGQIDFFSILLIFAAIAGIIYIAEGAIYVALGMYSDGIRIALFGLYCFTGGLWSVTDAVYPYLTLLVSPPWVAALLDMTGLLLFPIALAFLMRYYIRGKRTSRIMNGVIIAEIINAVVCLLFQIVGKADLIEQQLIIGGVALACLGTAMVCVVLELLRYRDNYLILMFLTVLPVLLSEIVDGINIIWPFMPRRVLMQYSFGLSILLLVIQLASYAHAELVKVKSMRHMESELVNSRISIMLSQIQPHFLYNSLSGIKLLCDTNPQRASEALEHFAFYLRGNLDALTNTQLVPFEKELVHMRDYLYLEKMRFSKKLNIEWELTYLDFVLPPLTVQPLIENAIRHGINKKKGGGTLTIRCECLADDAVITIHDDGMGFDLAEKKVDGRSHIGIENTRERLQTLCGGSLLLESEKGVGTTVKIVLPQKEARV